MIDRWRQAVLVIAAALLVALPAATRPSELAWPAPARESRPWVRWWWMGSAVNRPELSRQLEALAAIGIGGVEVTPIYGAYGYEEQYVDFLSPAWMDLLRHTVSEARRLGLGVDLDTGTGWPFGGPQISPALAAQRAAWRGRLVVSGTGQTVKRAAPGGEGLVMDPFSRAALTAYLARFDAAFIAAGTPGVRAFFNDSFEAYGADWTPDLIAQFQARRGYDLAPHLPALFGFGRPDAIARVRHDYRETISDLLLTEFTVPWTDWAHARSALSRDQAHGSPANLIDLYAAADVPETETYGSSRFPIPGLVPPRLPANFARPQPLLMKFASSAANLSGKPLVSAEACTWLGEHFTVSLAQIKPELDQLFAAGVNHVFFHGAAYSPADAPWPGWLFYAPVEFTPANPIWRDLPALNLYVARVQAALQSGRPDHDLLLYWPVHDLWQCAAPGPLLKQFDLDRAGVWLCSTPFGRTAAELDRRGYTYDYISDRQLAVWSGSRPIIVPPCRLMPPETLARLTELARQGATVIFAGGLPRDVPGLHDLEPRRERLRELNEQISRPGQGTVLVGDGLDALLVAANVRREPIADAGLRFERRRDADGELYFIANLGTAAFDGWAPLSVAAESAAILDPVTGADGLAVTRRAGASTEVYLQLPPGGSLIVRTFAAHAVGGPAWCYLFPSGPARELTGRWEVEFIEGGPELPPAFTTSRLASWTELGGPRARAFAGTARYTLRFERPAGDADDYVLDLGRVAESARVRVNGRDLGVFFCLPFRLPIGAALTPGTNTLELEVTNLATNRIADLDRRRVKWKYFRDANVSSASGLPFNAALWRPLPSGLLGPVTLTPCARKDLLTPPRADKVRDTE